MIRRFGSAHGCEATHRPVVSMSLNASRRWGPLSASSKARPNPVEPRTLGSTHAYPCERKKAVVADQRIRELYAGPPWYETITGSLPERAWAQAGPSTF